MTSVEIVLLHRDLSGEPGSSSLVGYSSVLSLETEHVSIRDDEILREQIRRELLAAE